MKLQIGSITVEDRRQEFNGTYRLRELSDIKYLAIHHVGAGAGDITAESIARYHTETLRWGGIGYHFLTHQEGSIEYVGDILTMRYHVGPLNRQAIGINIVGDWTDKRPPQVQLNAAKALCANLQMALGWFVPIRGHRELPQQATVCPGATSVGEHGWLDWLREGLERP